MIKNLPANAGDEDVGLTPESGKYPGGGHGNPLPYSCLESSMHKGALVGYSPWGRKKSYTTERLNLSHFDCLSSFLLD